MNIFHCVKILLFYKNTRKKYLLKITDSKCNAVKYICILQSRVQSFFVENNFKLWKIGKLECTKIYRVNMMCKNSKYSEYNIHGIEKNEIDLYLNFTSLNRISNLRKHPLSNHCLRYPILIFYIIFDRVITTRNITF